MFGTHLQNIGLTLQQATVYDFLAVNGLTSASKISRQTSVPRSMTYVILHELIELKLVERDVSKSVARFAISNPQNINSLVSKKITDMELARKSLEIIEHPLQKQYAVQSGQPGVRFYSGLEGLKKVYRDINISETNEIWLVRTNTQPNQEMFDVITEQVKKQIQSGIAVKVINSSIDIDLNKYINNDKERLTERRIISAETFHNPSQLIIYSNKLAITTYNEPMMTIIIEHDDIATTLRSMFQFIWRQSLSETKTFLNKLRQT